jgi:prepilin-type N-terminal cleavage/methylation domain-containing protein
VPLLGVPHAHPGVAPRRGMALMEVVVALVIVGLMAAAGSAV